MKKSLKIFAASLAVTTALLSFAFIASADDAQAANSPEIVSTNIAYEGNYGMLIAVDAETVTGDSVTVKVWEKGVDEATATTYTAAEAKADANIGNSTYFVVHTNAIAQKDMDKVFCYKAVDGTNEGAVMEYSVAEYFFDRLFVNDIVNATEADDVKRKNLYIATLNQGALAQDVLYNCDNDDTNDKAVLVNELNFYADFVTKTTEIYDNDTTQVTLAGDAATKYTVTKYDADFNATSETVVGGTAVVVDAHTVVTELKAAPGSYYDVLGGVDYNENSAYWHGKYGYAYGTYNNTNSSATGYTLYDKSGTFDTSDNRLHLNLAEDPKDAANKVLWMHRHSAPARVDLVFSNNKTELATGNCLVFETKVMLTDMTGIDAVLTESVASDYIYMFYINKTEGDFNGDTGAGTWWSGTAGDTLGCIYAKPNADSGYTYYLTGYNAEDTSAKGGELKLNEWSTITFEAYENGVVKMFVNGTYLTSKTFKSGGVDIDATYNSILTELRWGMTGGAGLYFDDTFVGIIDKEFATE